MEETSQRQIWVDNVKVISIILVALGHLIQSFLRSGILPSTSAPLLFNNLIYYFHVPLFFICSGFLYQHLTKKQDFKGYSKNVLKKLVAFSIPYFTFSIITYLLKNIFSSSVNDKNETSLIYNLFVDPISPYWFLYALIILFILSPILKSKADAFARIIIAVGLNLLIYFVSFLFLPDMLKTIAKYICFYLIWFVLGMSISYFEIPKYFKNKQWCIIFFFVFAGAASFVYMKKINIGALTLIFSLTACLSIIFFIGSCYAKSRQTKIFGFLAKYTTPVFVMHTIFAAGVRAVLLKFSVTNSFIHLIAGVIASIVFPVIAAMIMEKLKLDILYNPTKYIKIK